MPVSFDMTQIEALRSRVQQLTTPAFSTEIAQVLSVSALALISDGFRYGRDPYGDEWAPLKSRNGRPLLDTGRMRSSVFVARVGADGFAIRFGANYAIYHQRGTRPSRQGGRVLRQSARGRFVKAGRTAYLNRIGAYTQGGIPKREMVPSEASGISYIWAARFNRDARSLVRRRIRGA